jgi:RHS repeat-associated protein
MCPDGYIDSPVCRFRDANSSTGDGTLEETIYYLNDANFNIVALVNTSGAVIERYAYSTYGEVKVLDENYDIDSDGVSDVENELLFQGLRRDSLTGLIDNRLRIWIPPLGRFGQRDPLGYPDGMNAYAGYHVMWGGVDPLGLRWNKTRPPTPEETRRLRIALCVMDKLGLTRATPDGQWDESRQMYDLFREGRFLIGERGDLKVLGETVKHGLGFTGRPEIIINRDIIPMDTLLPSIIYHELKHVNEGPITDAFNNLRELWGSVVFSITTTHPEAEENRMMKALTGYEKNTYEITCCSEKGGDPIKKRSNRLNDAYCECGDETRCVKCPPGYKRQ